MQIRHYVESDRAEWERMRTAPWPGQTSADRDEWLDRLDAITIVADSGAGQLCWFIEVGERSIAESCTGTPVT